MTWFFQNDRSGQRDVASNSLTDRNIRNLSFDKAQGGTLTLGGANNQNGQFALKNSAGSNVITMDNTGMTVTNGTITIKDTNNTTILDATGLVSAANFPNGSYEANSTISTTSTSYVDVSGSSLTFTLVRSTKVLISFSCDVYYGGSTAGNRYGAQVGVNVDGSLNAYNPSISMSWGITGATFSIDNVGTLSFAKIYTLAAGSHTIKLQWKSTSTDNVNMLERNLYYIILGT